MCIFVTLYLVDLMQKWIQRGFPFPKMGKILRKLAFLGIEAGKGSKFWNFPLPQWCSGSALNEKVKKNYIFYFIFSIGEIEWQATWDKNHKHEYDIRINERVKILTIKSRNKI